MKMDVWLAPLIIPLSQAKQEMALHQPASFLRVFKRKMILNGHIPIVLIEPWKEDASFKVFGNFLLHIDFLILMVSFQSLG